MSKLIDEILIDVNFIRSHTLQPRWYKLAKVFILVGFLAAYVIFFGWLKTGMFLACFVLLSLMVHMFYRVKTRRWTQSWLDFVVIEANGARQYGRIGAFYYIMIALSASLSIALSQILG